MTAPQVATLDRGRAAFTEGRFGEAYAQLSAADRERALDPDDLERLAIAAFVTGHSDAGSEVLARGYHEALKRQDQPAAMRCALWSGWGFVETGEFARAEGWFLRAKALVDEGIADCVEKGYMLLAYGYKVADAGRGDIANADELFDQAIRFGQRFGDRTLITAARQARSMSRVSLGRVADGVALLDEVLVAVTTGEVSPLFVGNIYCGSIETCKEIFDLRRAHEWTAALTRWCESDPDLVPRRGACLVYRAEIMRLHGQWPDAMEELERARAALGDATAQGAARYQEAELHRLRGDFARADAAYRAASTAGHSPLPGHALLLLAQGDLPAARAAIRRALDEERNSLFRARLLPAFVEIQLAGNEVAAAAAGAAEHETIASANRSDYLDALAGYARASVALASGDTGVAPALRSAWAAYRDLDAPYEAARARELLGLAYVAQGDTASAEMEFDAARAAFEQLLAAPDAERLRRRSGARAVSLGALTARELEILTLVATGKTNRAIANDLVISEKTVARHLSNIFDKIGVSSRSAVTAFAYEHGLAKRAT
jgi:DNA-binding CsgD family transcriptional regulator